jgi:hypothetical protein
MPLTRATSLAHARALRTWWRRGRGEQVAFSGATRKAPPTAWSCTASTSPAAQTSCAAPTRVHSEIERTRTPGKKLRSLSRSSTSPVWTRSPRSAALAITKALIVVARFTLARASLASRAMASVSGSIRTDIRMFSRRSLRPRHHSPMTTVGTVIGTCRSFAPLVHLPGALFGSFEGDEHPGVEVMPWLLTRRAFVSR